jgi:hypothetical protein
MEATASLALNWYPGQSTSQLGVHSAHPESSADTLSHTSWTSQSPAHGLQNPHGYILVCIPSFPMSGSRRSPWLVERLVEI